MAWYNTTGHENTALGSYSLLSNTVGINNTAIGHQSLIANTSAGRNTAVGVSALLFAFLHVNPWQFFGPLALGVLFGWWYLRTGSLVPCMIGHALFNGLAYFSEHAPFDIPGFTVPHGSIAPAVHQPLWLTLGGAAVALLGLWGFHQATPPPAVPPLLASETAPATAG